MRKIAYFLVFVVCFSATDSFAGIGTVYEPYVEQGMVEIENRGSWVLDDDGGQTNNQKHKLAVGYGINSWWSAEGYLLFKKKDGSEMEFDGFEVENKFQLSEQGEYFLDYGMLVEIEKKDGIDKWEVKAGPLLKKDIGRWSLIGNFIAETQYGADRGSSAVNFIRKGQLRYRWSNRFEPMLEYQADDDFRAVGPMAQGSARLQNSKFKWIAGVLFGVDGDAADTTFRWEFEIEF